jgi:acyl carrier protein
MPTTDVAEEIRTFIEEEVLEGDAELTQDQPLLTGLLDSFGLMALLGFIEERYEMPISNDLVVSENFGSVEAVARFINGKLAERA